LDLQHSGVIRNENPPEVSGKPAQHQDMLLALTWTQE